MFFYAPKRCGRDAAKFHTNFKALRAQRGKSLHTPKSVAGSGTQPQVSRCLFASFSALEKEDIHLKPRPSGEVARLAVTERDL